MWFKDEEVGGVNSTTIDDGLFVPGQTVSKTAKNLVVATFCQVLLAKPSKTGKNLQQTHSQSFEKWSFYTIILSLMHYYLLTNCRKLLVYACFSQWAKLGCLPPGKAGKHQILPGRFYRGFYRF